MSQYDFLNDQFLIAMPTMKDPSFYHAVAYICEHNDSGAMGLIINQPIGMPLSELFASMEIGATLSRLNKHPILLGGPVQQERGFVMHRPDNRSWEASVQLSDQVVLTSSRDILEAIADNDGPQNPLVSLGYAGWGRGQLEQELLDNCWLHCPADPDIIFDTPLDKRWEMAAATLGVDMQKMSTDVGHG